MDLPERFSNLPEYAFPRLRGLLDPHAPGGDVVHLTLGEPKHAFPPWVSDVISEHAAGFNRYPPNEGAPELRQAFCDWLERRYGVKRDPETEVMPLNGTREGLYNITMALCPEQKNGQKPAILLPNPFYQVYLLAAISAQAEPVLVPATATTGHLPDYSGLPTDLLDRTAGVYICSPANPQGAVASMDYWRDLLALAEKHDFIIYADECYSEIYRTTPPPGLLEAAMRFGADPERVVAFHSLSKRSNLPGLRSGFVVSGPKAMKEIRQLRNYAGTPLPLPLQHAAAAVWADEAHVDENRTLYGEKYTIAETVFGGLQGFEVPEAGFFLWLPIDDGETAALRLWKETGVRVLPGAYLARDVDGFNPGKAYIRVAMVAPKDEMERGLYAIRNHLYER